MAVFPTGSGRASCRGRSGDPAKKSIKTSLESFVDKIIWIKIISTIKENPDSSLDKRMFPYIK